MFYGRLKRLRHFAAKHGALPVGRASPDWSAWSGSDRGQWRVDAAGPAVPTHALCSSDWADLAGLQEQLAAQEEALEEGRAEHCDFNLLVSSLGGRARVV